jgi:hypothetical protein
MSGASLAVPGILYVGPSGDHELAVLHVGPAAGWVALKELRTWSREISVVAKTDVTETLRKELSLKLPETQAAEEKLASAERAAQASVLVAVDSSLVDDLAKKVRVHTVGSDRITGGFYYFAKGGSGAAVRAQGNLIEMVAPALASADNAAVEATLDGLIGRLVTELSEGLLSEARLELAAALPALGEPASEATARLQTLEGFLVVNGARATRYDERARAVVEAVGQATRQGKNNVEIPLFGAARRVVQPEIEVEFADGDAGEQRKLTLPEASRWLVAGLPSETMPPPAVIAVADEKAAAEKAAAEKAAAEKAAAAKAAAEKAAAEKAAAEKAAAEKAAAEKAAAEKAAAEKAAAEKAAAEKAAAEKAAAEKAAAEKATAEKAAAEKAAAKKAAADKPAERKAEKKADKKADKKAAAKTEKKAAAAKEPASAKAAPVERSRSEKPAAALAESSSPTPTWVWLVLLVILVAGAYYFVFARHH